VLFHWYHGGSIPIIQGIKEWEREPMEDTDENDQLIPFLRSVVERPDLACSVRAFTLFSVDFLRTYAREHASLARYMARNVGIEDGDDPGLSDNWLDRIAPLVLPNLMQCLVVCMPGPSVFYLLRKCTTELSNLRYLALSPWSEEGSYHILEISPFLACIPNLEVLIAPDCGAETDWDLGSLRQDSSWHLRLDSLRVLSVSGLAPEFLAGLLRCCPAVEDLECFCGLEKEYPILTLKHIGSAQAKLRRLCYSVTPPHVQDGSWKDDEYINELSEDLRNRERDLAGYLSYCYQLDFDTTALEPFDASVYQKLEILEIEQILLYGSIFDYESRPRRLAASSIDWPEIFMSRLPPLLRILHLGMVVAWPELRRDLIGLASVANMRFPRLRIVRVDTFQDRYHDALREDEVREMTNLFRSVGIVFSAGPTPEGSSSRGMLGPRPGCPEIWRVLPTLYSLD
jgi:hypothetical protein